MTKDFLITGHGRSGTHYMMALFHQLGYMVKMTNGSHGICHHYPFHIIEWPYDKWRDSFGHMIHYVRNPKDVVESTYLHKDTTGPNKHSQGIVAENASKIPEIRGGSDLEQTIKSVVLWNRAIEDASPSVVVHVEDAIEACISFLEKNEYGVSNGRDVRKGFARPPKNQNHRHHPEWTRASVPWDTVSGEIMSMLNAHCARYGYAGIT